MHFFHGVFFWGGQFGGTDPSTCSAGVKGDVGSGSKSNWVDFQWPFSAILEQVLVARTVRWAMVGGFSVGSLLSVVVLVLVNGRGVRGICLKGKQKHKIAEVFFCEFFVKVFFWGLGQEFFILFVEGGMAWSCCFFG